MNNDKRKNLFTKDKISLIKNTKDKIKSLTLTKDKIFYQYKK